MGIAIEKIPGGFIVDGLELKNGKCGCTSMLPCCYSWSKIKRSGNSFVFSAKTTGPDTKDAFSWSYTVTKEDTTVEVSMEDARDKKIFSGYYPPRIEEWIDNRWVIVRKEGEREDVSLWRCSACKWLFKQREQKLSFEDLPPDWYCPVCKTKKDVFEKIG